MKQTWKKKTKEENKIKEDNDACVCVCKSNKS